MALFGRETRYVLRLYLQRIFIFISVVLAIVLSLDVASNVNSVMSKSSEVTGIDGLPRLLYYVYLRGGYVLPSILPFAGIVGVVWAEYGLAVSLERTMIFISGRVPVYSLIPAIIVGLLMGLFQYAALGYVRPASVEEQTASTYRYYGPKFRRPFVTDPQWIASDGAFVNAKVYIGDYVAFKEVVSYNLDDRGKLESIVTAASARPSEKPGYWVYYTGTKWEFSDTGDDGISSRLRLQEAQFETLEKELKINPLWAENINIKPRYLPQPMLAKLVSAGDGAPQYFQYATAYQERYASVFFSVAMTLLGAYFFVAGILTHYACLSGVEIGDFGYFRSYCVQRIYYVRKLRKPTRICGGLVHARYHLERINISDRTAHLQHAPLSYEPGEF